MQTITIDGKKYVPVSERILELHAKGVRFSLTSNAEYLSEINCFMASATLTIHEAKKDLNFTGMASIQMGPGDYSRAALPWAETAARGRAIGLYLAPDLKAIGAEQVSSDEMPEWMPSPKKSLTDQALKAIKSKK